MNELVGKALEQSLIGGAFILLLYYVIKNQNTLMRMVVHNMEGFGKSLSKVAETLLRIDMRLATLEQRISEVERKVEEKHE